MRTVFIGAHETPNGVNSYTYNLALELNKRGHESLVMSFGSCNKKTDYKGVVIKQYRTLGGTMTSIPLLYLKSLPYLIKHRKEIDIVMYQTVTFSVIPSLIVRIFGMKTCAIIHSLAEDSPKHGSMMKKILMISMRWALAFTRNVITVSHTKAREVYERYKKICNVLPCGVFLPEERTLNVDFLDKNGIKAEKFFLTIGRIDPIKNYEVLIDAFKQHDYGEYQLVIGGDVDNDYGRYVVKRAGDCRNIIFPGIVYGDLKATLLRNCIAYCLVSSSEGLPIALLEGMSYGKIPIVTRIPAIKEVLEKSDIGLWSDVKNVEQVSANMKSVEAANVEDIKAQEKKIRKVVIDNYTWPQICDQYLELVKKF